MTFEEFLVKHNVEILKRWVRLMLETYPEDSARLLKQEKDPFRNPVGATLAREAETLLEGLLKKKGPDELCGSLDGLMRLRSVQDFSPSQAVGIIFLLKKAVREVWGSGELEKQVSGQWLEWEDRIDDLALRAFDVYMACREKIYEIRMNEAKTQKEMVMKILERISHPAKK